MARRPNTGSREQLTPAELGQLRAELAAMKPYQLEIYYKASHNACAFHAQRVPCPRVIQEFVQAWKALRRSSGRPER